MQHERYMQQALLAAKSCALMGETPVGAVVVYKGETIAVCGNLRETRKDPTAHAEILAIQGAAAYLARRRLSGCTLYVTLEPCPMCAGAIAMSCLDAVYFGAYDSKSGCCGSVYRLTQDPALHLSPVPCFGGILAQECAALLQQFFSQRR